MATSKQKPLLRRPFDNDRISCDSDLGRHLLATVKVTPEKADRFLTGVSASIDAYLKREADRPNPASVRREITALAAVIRKAREDDGRDGTHVADVLDSLSADARRAIEPGTPDADLLDWFSPDAQRAIGGRAVTAGVPTRDDLTDIDQTRRAKAMELLHGLCVTGGRYVEGRRRSSGRQSRPVLKRNFTGPPVAPHRPKNEAELELCMFLAIDYVEATGRSPVRYPDRRRDRPGRRGPFVEFVQIVLNAIGAKTMSAEELVRRHDERRRAELKERFDRWYRRLRRLDQLRRGAW
jgi:hypothetical protein